ncbi:hypothetical protein HU200_040370 [Digitaria exilis]|uniref:CASP-like protein n=1 Tax=Digitaria exilis TaxID=1010633 RepID=A0A835B8L0_9POAL|nr:hypothetical protein HU200_040370 [Digitaria exilis]
MSAVRPVDPAAGNRGRRGQAGWPPVVGSRFPRRDRPISNATDDGHTHCTPGASPSPASLRVPIRAEGGLLSKERRRRQLAADRRSRRRGLEVATMAAGEQTRAETILRGACAAMAAAAALLMGLSAQTKTVLFVQRRAVPKDVQALWVMIVTASAAAGYYVVQLARCLYMSHLAAGGGGCRRLRRRVSCVSFLLDKVRTVRAHAFALPRSAGSLFPDNQEDRACPVPNLSAANRKHNYTNRVACQVRLRSLSCSISHVLMAVATCVVIGETFALVMDVGFLCVQGCAYVVFATTVAALQACFVGLIGVEALQWSKLCNIYTRFCEQVAAGIICGMLAAVGMAVVAAFSARDLFRSSSSSSRAGLDHTEARSSSGLL